jgi:predicted amidophosphoribosyltransferase
MNDDTLILCPYCLTPIHEFDKTCPACKQSIVHDAPIELSRTEYMVEARQNCPFCGAEILALATLCPVCLMKQ